MTNEDIIKEIDAAAEEEAGVIFANIFAGQVVGKRDHQGAVDNCLSSLRQLKAFAAEVTKRLSEEQP